MLLRRKDRPFECILQGIKAMKYGNCKKAISPAFGHWLLAFSPLKMRFKIASG